MHEKPKILYVITQGQWGGAQRYVFDLATNLADDYDITVAVGQPTGNKDLQKKLSAHTNIRTLQLRHLRREISLLHDMLAVRELAKLYQALRPDIVHLNSSKAGIIGSMAPTSYQLRAIPICPRQIGDPRFCQSRIGTSYIIYTVHGWIFNEPLPAWKKMAYTWLEKITARYKKIFIVLSEAEKEQGQTVLGIAPEKMQIIPHGIAAIDFLSREAARQEITRRVQAALPLASTWIGCVANFYPSKGIDVLIQAAAPAASFLRQHTIILIGDGPERTAITGLIKRYNLDKNIFLTGELPQAARLLHAFDAIVLPSRKEGLPYTLLEAVQAGVPVVATAVGGVPEVVRSVARTRLAAPGDPADLTQALEEILQLPMELHAGSDGFSLAAMLETTRAQYATALGR